MHSLKNTLKKTNRETFLKKGYCGDVLKLKSSMKCTIDFLIKIRKVSSIRSLKNTLKKTNRETLLKNTLRKTIVETFLY